MLDSFDDFSLASGLGGLVLLRLEESLRSPSIENCQILSVELEKLLRNPRKDLSLFYGEGADLWLLNKYLQHIPSSTLATELLVRYQKWKVRSRQLLTLPGRSELIRGAVGFGVLGRSMKDDEFLEEILTYFETQSPHFFRLEDTGDVSSDSGTLSRVTDLGLAHGISGILAFLVSYEGSPEEERARRLSEVIFTTLAREAEAKKLLPKFTPDGENSWHQGWCYGNLSTAYALKLAGSVWETKKYTVLADSLWEAGLNFHEVNLREIPDHLCHGKASLNLLSALMDSLQKFPMNQDRTKKEGGFLNGEIGVRLALLRDGRFSLSRWEDLLLLGRSL